jgi:hypothetical protein
MPKTRTKSDKVNVSDWMKKTLFAAIEQADRTKKDISTLVAKEVRVFLDSIEVAELLKKVIAGQSIEISAKIKFVDDKKADKKTAPKAAFRAKKSA